MKLHFYNKNLENLPADGAKWDIFYSVDRENKVSKENQNQQAERSKGKRRFQEHLTKLDDRH